MNSADLEREFAPRSLPNSGGLLLLDSDDALSLVRRAAQAGVPILGIDGMFLRDRRTESPIGHVADYSAAVALEQGCWSAAEAFIEARRPLRMVFEVVLGEFDVSKA